MSRPTQVYANEENISFVYGTLTLYGRAFQPRSARQIFSFRFDFHKLPTHKPTTPRTQRFMSLHAHGLGCSLFARHYWGNVNTFFIHIGGRKLHWTWIAPTPGSLRTEYA